MADVKTPSALAVLLQRSGETLTNVVEWSIDSAFMVSTDAFSFTLYDEDTDNLRGLELQPVELLVNGASQAIGRIDKTRRGHSGSRVVACTGRDFIADLVECNVDPALKLKAGDTLVAAVLMAASPAGVNVVEDDFESLMSTIRSGRKAGGGSKNSKKSKPANEFKPDPGEGIYEFLNKIVSRSGATIQPGKNRNTLVIGEPNYKQQPLYRLVRTDSIPNGPHNNIVSGVAERDYSSFPTFAMLSGQQAKSGTKSANATFTSDMWTAMSSVGGELFKTIDAGAVSDRWKPGKCADQVKTGSLYRLLVFRDEKSRDSKQVEAAAKRAIGDRLKETLVYQATVKGHVDPETGAIWSVDTMIQVDDDIADVHEPLWIAARTLRYSEGDGAMTDIECWRPASFNIGE